MSAYNANATTTKTSTSSPSSPSSVDVLSGVYKNDNTLTKYTEIVIIKKSKRIVPLLWYAKWMLVYHSLWHTMLVICQVFLFIGSAFQRRNLLVLNNRYHYWFYGLVTIGTLVWLLNSFKMFYRKDNLSLMTILGLLALILIFFESITICCLVCELAFNSGVKGMLFVVREKLFIYIYSIIYP